MQTNPSPIYEGKAKKLYREDGGVLVQEFKNSATAFNGQKKAEFPGKGEFNARMSAALFDYLQKKGMKTHLLSFVEPNIHRIMELEMIPAEVVVRNFVAGSLAKRSGKAEGSPIEPPLVEWFLKDDAKGDPQMSEEQLIKDVHQNSKELEQVKKLALEVNRHLTDLFQKVGLKLVDFKLEFGRDKKGKILLADEISPDTCRIWDQETGEKLDKDRFRFDLGDLLTGYRKIWERLQRELVA